MQINVGVILLNTHNKEISFRCMYSIIYKDEEINREIFMFCSSN